MKIQSRHFWTGLLLSLGLSAQVYCQSHPASESAGRGIISLPDKDWGVELDLPGFTIKSNGMKPDGRRYLLASNNGSGVIVSITLEEYSPGNPHMACKEIMKSRVDNTPDNLGIDGVTEAERKNIKIWEVGDKTFMDYSIPKVRVPGQKPVDLNQQNRFLCFQHEDAFVDLHISKPNFQPGEQTLFDPILDSIKIHEGLVRTSTDYFLGGSSYYNQGDFKRAIPFYARALALEQQDPKLEKKFWYVLVDNLGMAYAMNGELEAARKTFEYGIQQTPDYPMFYYEMADYYGEKQDLQNAMAFLQKAWNHRENLLPGEKFPDARKDDSFKKLLRNSDFQKLVETLNTPILTHRPSN